MVKKGASGVFFPGKLGEENYSRAPNLPMRSQSSVGTFEHFLTDKNFLMSSSPNLNFESGGPKYGFMGVP